MNTLSRIFKKVNNNGMKLPRVLLLCATMATLMVSCTKDIDGYYNPKNTLDKNIIEVLEADGRFSVFVGMIDRLELRTALGSAAIYTCLAPLDEHVNAYFRDQGYAAINQVPETQLRNYVNYHFIYGMNYEYDFRRRYQQASTLINETRATSYRTRGEGNALGKLIRVYAPGFWMRQADDYNSLFGFQPAAGAFMIEGALVSATSRDISASNGVIHVLETPLKISLRTDEALANDPETSIFSKWLERHVQYQLGEKDEFGWVDTTLYKTYSIGRNLADEGVLSTLTVPTDDAIRAYFEPHMADLDYILDSVPQRVMYSLLRASIIENMWFKSDLERKQPEWRAITGFPHAVQDVVGAIKGATQASNSIIYKTDRVIESPEMHSVQGGIYMKHKQYSQWYWMFQRANLAAGLTDGLYYQHSPATLLVQPDDVWGFPLAQDLQLEERELRYQECRSGILNVDVRADGGFRKRFYPTDFGYVLYDAGRFYDYTGHSVRLLTNEPVWERTNGSIHEIDGFLTPLDRLDPDLTVWTTLDSEPELTLFADALQRAGADGELQLTGFFTYTVMAPSDQAIVNAGIDLNVMSETDLRRFVMSYIIQNRRVFSDGVFNGLIANKNGEMLTVNGAWDSFSVTKPGGNAIRPIQANLQGSNGVVHIVNDIF